jgi:DNA adenine methylase
MIVLPTQLKICPIESAAVDCKYKFDTLESIETFLASNEDQSEVNMSLLRYYGSKWSFAKWITSNFPPQEFYDCFVDAYGGSGAITFAAPNVPIKVWNDKSKYLWTFMKVLRERADELIDQIMLTPYSRFELSQCGLPKDATKCDLNELEIARRFWVLSWQSRGNRTASNLDRAGWRYHKSNGGVYAPNDFYAVDDVYGCAQMLQRVQIECVDALKLIKTYDSPRTLFYLDPPYSHESDRNYDGYYQHEMAEHEHRDLIELIKSIKGYAVISGYDSSLYRDLLSDWECRQKSTLDGAMNTRTEYLWSSPNISAIQLRMF